MLIDMLCSCRDGAGNQGQMQLEVETPETQVVDMNNEHPVEVNTMPVVEILNTSNNNGTLQIDFRVSDDDSNIQMEVWGYDQSEEELRNITEQTSGSVGAIETDQDLQIAIDISNANFSYFQLRAKDNFEPALADVLDLVSEKRIENDISMMEGTRHFRSGVELLSQTRGYIKDQYALCGVASAEHRFNRSGEIGVNIIGSIEGISHNPPRMLIIGHYDTIETTPGADDNASGTAGVLEAMRILSQFSFEYTIDFIALDMEELGLVGSKRYVAEIAKDQNILGVINFEMIGYTCTMEECAHLPLANSRIYNIASVFATDLQNTFSSIGADYVPELTIQNTVDDGNPNFRRSDHAPFWDAGIPALFITDGANFRNPHYHQTTDELQTLDLVYATRIVKTAVGTVASLSNISHQGVATIEM